MILTICICSLDKRAGMLATLLREIEKQIDEENAKDIVEILVDADDGKVSTGVKRNKLYNQAQGIYVCSIDDDDEIASYYIKEILNAANEDCDAIAMNGRYFEDGRGPYKWFISRINPYCAARDPKGFTIYLRYHNHLSAIKKEIAIQYPFPDKYIHEDSDFANALHRSKAIKTEAVIGTSYFQFMQRGDCIAEKPMYTYRFRSIK